MSAQHWFNRMWYERQAPPVWLLPIAHLYSATMALRRALYRAGWLNTTRLSCPVIIIGNLSVGGTGKTPLVLWLVEALQRRGFKPGIVTRGYGGSSREPRLVAPTDAAALVGDEAVVLSRRSEAPVAAGRRRATAAQLLLAAGCDVVVSDDGLQHYALARDCELVVIDGQRGFGNGRLLPAGPLREPKSRLATVDALVQNGGTATSGRLQMRLSGDEAVGLRDGSRRPLTDFMATRAHAVAGIGNPQRFFDLLSGFGIDVVGHPLTDHARLGPADIRFDDDWPVFMTEKDAVKCLQFAGPRQWFVPVRAEFEPLDAAQLLAMVERKIGKHG